MKLFSQQDGTAVGGGDSLHSLANNAAQTDGGKQTLELPEKTGHWLRRRRLDGALNRLPEDFYPRIWRLLEKSQGLTVTENMFLSPNLTNEVTKHLHSSTLRLFPDFKNILY